VAELNPAPPVRIEAASSNEQGSARDARSNPVKRTPKSAAPPAREPQLPDIDLEESEHQEKHRLDERA